MMNWEGLTTLHVAKQQEVKINIEKRTPKIQIDTKIHSIEQLVIITNVKPSWGHVWTLIKNDVFRY
jgi:hypothetical protein